MPFIVTSQIENAVVASKFIQDTSVTTQQQYQTTFISNFYHKPKNDLIHKELSIRSDNRHDNAFLFGSPPYTRQSNHVEHEKRQTQKSTSCLEVLVPFFI